MENKKILISGAGIAGLTLAYFLQKEGFQPIIIEKAATLRDGGHMIDFFSSGVSVAEKMGIVPELKEKDHSLETIQQYNSQNKKDFSIYVNAFRAKLNGKFFNFLRTDLIDILYHKIKDEVEIRFNTSISQINQQEDSVKVIFDNNEEESFDLLVGADGFYSNVRNLTYDKELVEKKYLGFYVAGFEHNEKSVAVKEKEFHTMLCPKLQLSTYQLNPQKKISLLVFESPKLGKINFKEKTTLIKKLFKNFAEPAQAIIQNISEDKKMFFDEVSQIKIKEKWYKNRVILVGDAAYCLTLLSGQGASMAMTGAYVLSQQLVQSKGEHTKAFLAYEKVLRPTIEKMQKKAVKNALTFLPTSPFKLWLRNLLLPFFFKKIFLGFIVKQIGADNFFKKKANKF